MKFIFRILPGFTLVEIMIVIAIIGVLAIALFPVLGNYFARSRDVALLKDAKTLQTALESYYIDKGFYPIILNYPTQTELMLQSIKDTVVPNYITRLPAWIYATSHKYASNLGGTFYAILLFTEVLYRSDSVSQRWPTCLFGVYNQKPLMYGNLLFSDYTSVPQPICSFQ